MPGNNAVEKYPYHSFIHSIWDVYSKLKWVRCDKKRNHHHPKLYFSLKNKKLKPEMDGWFVRYIFSSKEVKIKKEKESSHRQNRKFSTNWCKEGIMMTLNYFIFIWWFELLLLNISTIFIVVERKNTLKNQTLQFKGIRLMIKKKNFNKIVWCLQKISVWFNQHFKIFKNNINIKSYIISSIN